MTPKKKPIAKFADIQVGDWVMVNYHGCLQRPGKVVKVSPTQFSTGRDRYRRQDGKGLGSSMYAVGIATQADLDAWEAKQAAERLATEARDMARKERDERLQRLKGSTPDWCGYVDVRESQNGESDGFDVEFFGLSSEKVTRLMAAIRAASSEKAA